MRYARCVAGELHIVKSSSGDWEVRGADGRRTTSVHPNQAEALAAGRRLALQSGGAKVVVHRADGRIRTVEEVGAATLDQLERSVDATPRPAPRAPRSEGKRTTLRVPARLAAVTDRLAGELDISHNDALLRLATRGARLYEAEEAIAARRRARWAAVVPGSIDVDHAELPSPEEARAAVLDPSEDEAATSTS
jgi:hypothetical protein